MRRFTKLTQIRLIITIIASFSPSWICEAMLIFYHNGVSTLYSERHKEGKLGPDPLETYDLERRQIICDHLIMAKEFKHLSYLEDASPSFDPPVVLASENYQRRAVLTENPEPPTHYTHYRVVLHRRFPAVKMFPCVYNALRAWYVTYGFRDGEMFLLTPCRDFSRRSRFKIVAIIQSSPALFVQEFWQESNLSLLREYFGNQVHKSVTVPPAINIPNRMKLNFLSISPHLRVCGAVFAAMSTPPNTYFQGEIRKVNYIRVRSKSVERSIKIVSSDMVYIIHDLILPCSINRHSFSYQFYLLADPLERTSVFVFVDTEEFTNQISLIGRVENLNVMLEVFKN